MAVLKMCKINICAMKKDRKKILELLQLKGCLEVHEEVKEDKVFEKVNTATQISLYERQAALTDNALEILEAYIPEEKSMLSSLEGKKVISSDDYYEIVNKRNEINGLVNDIIEQKKSMDEKESGKQKCLDEIQALQPWLELDVPMNFQGTKNTGFMVGVISGSYTEQDLIRKIESLKEFPKSLYMQIVSADKYQTYVTVSYMKHDLEQVEKALRQLDFSKPPIMVHHIPTASVTKREDRIKEYNLDIENIKAQMEREADYRFEFKKIRDYYKTRADKYKVVGKLLQSKHTFFVTGYMPEKQVEALKEELETKFNVAIDVEQPTEKENVPVLLTNGKVQGAVEGVVTSFGFPNKMEIDPTAITAFFYYFLFGIMLSDAAYGFLMFIGCFIVLKKFPNMEETMAKTLRCLCTVEFQH